MIDPDHVLPVSRQAEALGMARSTVYCKPVPLSAADERLLRQLDELHLMYPFAGSRKLTAFLRADGNDVGRRHVTTLMRIAGIETLYRKPRTTRRNQRTPCFRICCEGCPSPDRIRSGRWISPTFRCVVALCISRRCWIGTAAVS